MQEGAMEITWSIYKKLDLRFLFYSQNPNMISSLIRNDTWMYSSTSRRGISSYNVHAPVHAIGYHVYLGIVFQSEKKN